MKKRRLEGQNRRCEDREEVGMTPVLTLKMEEPSRAKKQRHLSKQKKPRKPPQVPPEGTSAANTLVLSYPRRPTLDQTTAKSQSCQIISCVILAAKLVVVQ